MQREVAAHGGGDQGRGDEGACWFWSLGKCTKGRKCKFAHMEVPQWPRPGALARRRLRTLAPWRARGCPAGGSGTLAAAGPAC
ncbi:unnamed protein product [Prorocentrum cordatum]|uniref:C3H1-type domain-containing protein n=1 Tax=Prorocentrum cordatum TaxID=2364126 RepID=A0ABN9VEQ7_9DINO|nr:unnamed protein product [Polarella glacialis]